MSNRKAWAKTLGKPQKRRSKYGAVKTVVDGRTFHSAKEARRYQELKLLQQAGKIDFINLQPEYLLMVKGVKLGVYRADFVYLDLETNHAVVEDVKGFKTPLYRWKKKHVEAQYQIKIREV